MTKIDVWPAGYIERLIALSKDLPDDFERPEPLPDGPERPSMDEPSTEFRQVISERPARSE